MTNFAHSLPKSLFFLALTLLPACKGGGGGGGDSQDPVDAPAVVSTTPGNGTGNVTADASLVLISATFDEDMDPGSLSSLTFFVNDGSQDIAGSVTYSNQTATFIPDFDLQPSTTYTARITSDARSKEGVNLPGNHLWNFRTTFAVAATDPFDTQTDVSVNPTIIADFSEDISGASITNASFTITGPDGLISGSTGGDGNRATFLPAGPLDKLGTYTARLSTSVQDSNGNPLLQEYTWTFTVVDRTWKTAGLLETDDDNNATWPDIDTDGLGNAIAVWSQQTVPSETVHARARRYSGGSWGVIKNLTEDVVPPLTGADIASQVTVDLSASGEGIVTWREGPALGNREIYGSTYDPSGGTWSLAGSGGVISAPGCGDADDPIAAWNTATDEGNGLFSQDLDSCGGDVSDVMVSTPSGPTRLDGGNTLTVNNIEAAFNPSGEGLAVWNQGGDILGNQFDGTSWSTDSPIFIESNGNAAGLPDLAMDDSGKGLAIWVQSDGFMERVWVDGFDGSNWEATPEMIDLGINPAEPLSTSRPAIAMAPSGSAIAVWIEIEDLNGDGDRDDGESANVMASQYLPGTGWSNPQLIDSSTGGESRDLDVAVDGDGNAVAVWGRYPDADKPHGSTSYSTIRASRFINGKGWGLPAFVESIEEGDARFPRVAVDSDGNFIVVWQQRLDTNGSDSVDIGDRDSVFSARFD